MKQCIVFSRFSIGYVRLQNSRFRKAGSAVSVILECERLSPFSLAVFSLAPAFRSNMVRRSRSQKNTAVLQSTEQPGPGATLLGWLKSLY